MKEWFLNRGYHEKVINNQIDKTAFDKNQSVKKTSESDIPIVTTYHPKVIELGKLIRDLLLFYSVMRKFKRSSHHVRWYHTKVLEK